MSATDKQTSRTGRIGRLGWLLVLLVCHAWPQGLAADPAAMPAAPLERFVWFVTAWPPIRRLVCQWKPNDSTAPALYEFRFQPSAFLGRVGTNLADLDRPLSPTQEAAGNWEADYWYLKPQGAAGRPELYTCRLEPDDWSNAEAGQARFMTLFSVVASFGLSEFGPGSVVPGRDAPLEIVFGPEQGPYARFYRRFPNARGRPPVWRYPVQLALSNDVPVEARFRRLTANGVEIDLKVTYGYDPNIAPEGIPTSIAVGPERWRTLKLELGLDGGLLPRSAFAPTELLNDPKLVYLVRSNRHDYLIADRKLVRVDDPNLALAALRGPPPARPHIYPLAILVVSLCLAPILVALGARYVRSKGPKKHMQ